MKEITYYITRDSDFWCEPYFTRDKWISAIQEIEEAEPYIVWVEDNWAYVKDLM